MVKNINEIFFVIQARLNSVRIPNKMLSPFANSNLFEIAINKVLSSNIIPKKNFYVSLNENELELIKVAKKYNLNIFYRSKESVQEPITLQKACEWYTLKDFKYFININACNPLIKVVTLDNFINSFLSSKFNGMFAVIEKRTFFYNSNGKMINKFFGEKKYLSSLETKFVDPTYEAAHTLYAGKMKDIYKGVYMGTFKKLNDPYFFVIPEEEFLDIDFLWQFKKAEELYINQQNGSKL